MTRVQPEEWHELRLVQTFWNKPQDVERALRGGYPMALPPPFCDVEDCVHRVVGLYATSDNRAAALCAGHAPAKAAKA